MKGTTAYDEALELLKEFTERVNSHEVSPISFDRALAMIADRQQYLNSHFRAVFFAMSNKNGKHHEFFEFLNETSDEDVNAELESWAEGLNNGWSYTKAAWIKLEDGQEFKYPDYNSF